MHPIAKILLSWYAKNKRELPWRTHPSPYTTWLSEIMLQQTRVNQGLGYFIRFSEKFPTVHDLAQATEEDVLKLWQGLGYYSRARNLHAAAKQVVNDHGGHFPGTAEQLRQLKGVGPYTAAAIASIAFNEPVAVVDGNVHRVISRLFDIDAPVNRPEGHRAVEQAMAELLPHNHAGDFNQAVMEFGALQCSPKGYDCGRCVLRDQCLAFARRTTDDRPIKAGKTTVKSVWFDYFVVEQNARVLMRQRGATGIWARLNDFPAVEWEHPASMAEIRSALSNAHVQHPRLELIAEPLTHLLSHRKITARFFRLDADFIPDGWMDARWVARDEIHTLPIPRLIERFLGGEGTQRFTNPKRANT